MSELQEQAINPDVAVAYEALTAKLADHNRRFDYYDGNQELVYSSQRLAKVFKGIDARFVINWCAVIVNSALDRLELQRFDVADVGEGIESDTEENAQDLADRLDQIWTQTGLAVDEEEVHTAVLVAGEAFVIAGRKTDLATGAALGPAEAYYNDPRLVYVHYDPAHPRHKKWAAKWWDGDDGRRHLVLYYQDRFEYYVSTGKAENVRDASAFEPDTSIYRDGQASNEDGEIPVFHFRRTRRTIKGELDDVLTVQDAVNKLFADLMVVGEFMAFRQRWVVGDAQESDLKNLPGAIFLFPPADAEGTEPTKVGEFAETNLGQYLETMDRLASWAAIISRTPKHYLYQQGGDPSGEALIAMESPLNKKVDRIITSLQPTWVELATFLLKLNGQVVDPTQLTAQYAQPATIQPKMRSEIREANKRAEIPLVTTLREEGMSDAEIQKVKQEKAEERAEAARSFAQAALDAQRRFDQGGEEEDTYGR